MKTSIRHLATLIGAAGFGLVMMAAAATEVPQVCWSGDYADPTLWKGTDGKYYAYSTPGGWFGKQYLVSTNGVSWKALGYGPFTAEVTTQITNDWSMIWAPDHAVVAGTNLLYVSLIGRSGGDTALDSAIGVFTLTGAEPGRAKDLRIITSYKVTGIRDTIDPEVATDPETGKVWLFFGSTGKMYRVELASDGLSVKSGATYAHVAGVTYSEDSTRAKVFEGAYLKKRGNWWYLFVSAGWYNNESYCLRVGRSRTLDGEFLDRDGQPMTKGNGTLLLGTEGDFYGPGHNGDILIGTDGVPRIYYHSHWKELGTDQSGTRILLTRPLAWDEEGWPSLDLTKLPSAPTYFAMTFADYAEGEAISEKGTVGGSWAGTEALTPTNGTYLARKGVAVADADTDALAFEADGTVVGNVESYEVDFSLTEYSPTDIPASEDRAGFSVVRTADGTVAPMVWGDGRWNVMVPPDGIELTLGSWQRLRIEIAHEGENLKVRYLLRSGERFVRLVTSGGRTWFGAGTETSAPRRQLKFAGTGRISDFCSQVEKDDNFTIDPGFVIKLL